MGEEKLRQNQEGKLLCKYFLLISSQLFSPFLLICRENCRLNFSSFMSCWEQFSLEADVYLWNQYNTTAANWRVKAWGWKVNIYPIHFMADLFPYSPNALRWLHALCAILEHLLCWVSCERNSFHMLPDPSVVNGDQQDVQFKSSSQPKCWYRRTYVTNITCKGVTEILWVTQNI